MNLVIKSFLSNVCLEPLSKIPRCWASLLENKTNLAGEKEKIIRLLSAVGLDSFRESSAP